jgi:hypothetical protein
MRNPDAKRKEQTMQNTERQDTVRFVSVSIETETVASPPVV